MRKTLLLFVLLLSAGTLAPAQTPTGADPVRRSNKWNLLLQVAAATVQAICDNTGRCPFTITNQSTAAPPATGAYPDGSTAETPGTPTSAAAFGARLTPVRSRDLVIFAEPDQYTALGGGQVDLHNGIMLYPAQIAHQALADDYRRFAGEVAGANAYLRGSAPVAQTVDGMPCLAGNFGGTNPRTRVYENVSAYVCDDNPRRLFFVAVTSGARADYYRARNQQVLTSLRRR